MPWTSSLMLAYGPGVGSRRRLLNDLLGRERAARNGLCGASPARLPRRRPVGAEPGLKSRPCFYVPSLQTPCQARGARVAGYPASGSAEAAYSALCQLAHNCAKPRGRQFTFLSGVFAALPRCPCHTVHLTRTDPVTIIATIRPLAGASCRQSAPQPAPAGCRFLPSSLLAGPSRDGISGLQQDTVNSHAWSPQMHSWLLPQLLILCCRYLLDDILRITFRTFGWSLTLSHLSCLVARPLTADVLFACQLSPLGFGSHHYAFRAVSPPRPARSIGLR